MTRLKINKEKIAEITSALLLIPKDQLLASNSLQHLDIQSLDIVELLCELEDCYGITLKLEEDMSWLMDLDQAVVVIQTKIDSKQT